MFKDNETLDDLIIDELKVIQKTNGFRFSIDAVLLAHFATVKKGDRIVDLGTGTGIIPLLLTSRNKQLSILGVEIQAELVDMAQRSVTLNNLANIDVIQGDLRKLEARLQNQFDLVVANPPYFPVNTGKINPNSQIAISRHELFCSLEDLVQSATKLLKDRGRFCLVHRSERLGEIINSLNKYKLIPKRLRMIHPQITGEANLVLIEAVKNSKQGLTIMKPLIIYDDNGNYTKEIIEYYGGEKYDR